MSYPTLLLALLQPEIVANVQQLANDIQETIREHEDELIRVAVGFVMGEATPVAMMEFEAAVAAALREIGRRLVEESVNRMEPDDAALLPGELTIHGDSHTPAATKTPHNDALCFFGKFTLFEPGYDRRTGRTRLPAFPGMSGRPSSPFGQRL